MSIFERMAQLQEEFDRQEIIKEVNDGRRRLNALPLVELKQQVKLQVAQKSKVEYSIFIVLASVYIFQIEGIGK
jgi:hypothetical protein